MPEKIRYHVEFTKAQLAAAREALTFRTAGPIDTEIAARSYDGAEEALAGAVRAEVVLYLTRSEAKGLLSFADEGAQGLLTDEAACRAYVGGNSQRKAAISGLQKLSDATP